MACSAATAYYYLNYLYDYSNHAGVWKKMITTQIVKGRKGEDWYISFESIVFTIISVEIIDFVTSICWTDPCKSFACIFCITSGTRRDCGDAIF